MLRIALVSAILFASVGSSRADTLPLLGVPSGYTPGVPVSFDVYAPGLSGLTDYTLQFTVTAGSPPNPPDLTVNATPPNNLALYPFPNASNFNATVGVSPGSNSLNVTITDSTSGLGVNTLLGVNDHLATIAISPGVNLSGPITVQFTLNEFTTSRDVGFDLPPAFVILQNVDVPPGSPVPAPPALVLLGIAGICLAGRNRWMRAAR